MARARLVGAWAGRPLDGTWELAAVPLGCAETPEKLAELDLDWVACDAPMPAAAALRAAGLWTIEERRDFDAEEWWYRCHFSAPAQPGGIQIRFEGLATVADVWLNGTHILRSENMFLEHAVRVEDLLCADNELVLRFHALRDLLNIRRPRPRWRTRLVQHQQLRWHRTTLLGRIPAWCPPVAPVGPWRPVFLEPSPPLCIEEADVQAQVEGREGIVRVAIRATLESSCVLTDGALMVADVQAPIEVLPTNDGGVVLHATARLPRAERWWPHTHGAQPLYSVRLSMRAGGQRVEVDLGRVGFRTLDVDRGDDGEGFGVRINGIDVFCRGVCWTPVDLARLVVSREEYRSVLERVRDAGMNMIRVGGTMVYEDEAFHDLCDELGILVWQDFMFANMDYPAADEAFSRSVSLEARQHLLGMQGRPSLAVLCGSSEVEQQAAMLGLPAATGRSQLFSELLPGMASELMPGVPWFPSTPTGGTQPFQADRGVTHYYGVGAYLRPLEDARRARVRFASECLGFSNVPEPETVDLVLRDGESPGHHPRWKERVPRDAGAGWDFEDVRDHYVAQLFGVDPVALRARDPERYLALGRTATAEVMLRVFSEWRSAGSSCRGGLVWFARDLWPGAGWGLIDSTGRPKAAYWYLKRTLAPLALLATDEGVNGLRLHAVNDTASPLEADLRVSVYREGRVCVAQATTSLTVAARSVRSIHADALFETFLDLTYAYRFGPPGHDVVAATLVDRARGIRVGSAHGFPCGLPTARDAVLGLAARAEPAAGGLVLHIQAERCAHAVAIEADGLIPDDNYFHLEPGELRRVYLRFEGAPRPLRGSVSALNGRERVDIALAPKPHVA